MQHDFRSHVILHELVDGFWLGFGDFIKHGKATIQESTHHYKWNFEHKFKIGGKGLNQHGLDDRSPNL